MNDLHTLQDVINQYSLIERRHYIPGTSRHEDDATHALSVAMICWHYIQALDLTNTLDTAKVLQYALIHDLVEIHAGDFIAYISAEERAKKDAPEQAALERLSATLSFNPSLVKSLQEYQHQENEETIFVWACDKIQAYTQGQIDGWRPYREKSIPKALFISKLNEQVSRSPVCIRDTFYQLATAWIRDYPEIT